MYMMDAYGPSLPKVSKLGFGCAGLSGFYNAPVPEDDGISIIKHAFSKGITFFDTSDAYGPKTNEVLVGKVGNINLHLVYTCSALFNCELTNSALYHCGSGNNLLGHEMINLLTKVFRH